MAEIAFGEFGGRGLGGREVAECYEEFVVDCAPIIEEGADDGLDSLDACCVQGGAGVREVSELLFGAVDDGRMAEGSVLGFLWDGVAPLEKEVLM